MRVFVSIWRLRFLLGMQYRTAALAGVATQLFFGLIFIMIYVAFYAQGSANAADISLEQIVSYVWLQQIFLSFIMLWYRDNEIFQLITSGNIAYELCRPFGIYSFWYAKLLGQRLSAAVLRCLPILFVVYFLPGPYRLQAPPSPAALTCFLLSLLLGLLLVVSVSMLIYISVFWTMSPTGSTLVISVAGEFFAGMIIPVPLMPEWLQKTANFLPFRWSADFPFRVYSGQIPVREAIGQIPAQLLWIAALLAFGGWSLRRALRKLVVQGG
ncbi:ABC transporter permease [Cohnella lubricantis]|uniref:ABC transporter permease n=1 Tax=Cohnella lubricantis TaxID=2163172 RepID=A0A841TBQ7_9BACL|nr:ABC transporter permease [Cohnella lubricantis]MBB6678442.1 ABC transporter permease [Cohnella lubricantis]MBP2116822.1 ABC-2 type transport system permease protein [Cohnella lubricantis]